MTMTKLLMATMLQGNKLGRYAEYAGSGNYTLWHGTTLESRYVVTDALPAWLQVIVDAAKVGGHITEVPHPPPMRVVWFEVDSALKLVKFVDRSKAPVSERDDTVFFSD